MDFLFDNSLANMYGPYFLVFYILFIIAAIVGFRIVRSRTDKTANFSIPPIPNNPDAFEIAYLRGGENELVRAVVFALAQKNLLKFISDDKKSPQIYPTISDFDRRNLSTVERTALGWFDRTREVKELFQKDGLKDALQPYYETYRARLEMQHFIPDETTKSRSRRLALQAFLVFGSLGAYKVIAAIYNGYWNVFGIVFITISGLFVLSLAAKMPRLTNLGKEYLKRLQLAFERIKPSKHYPIETGVPTSAAFAAVDPFLLSVGIFGGAALAGTIYSDYNLAFQKAQNNSTGSSCSSGCGSCSSSSGGDGGSGCGGGCGGCGG
ncbi:MAG: TIGR04222 domain-containing membrane protein [Pyrinomonadaceae bacterium]|nr:TIGR04222 domain-containing membrane protein [Pyrinomonadaceae bacterium]